MRFPLALGNPEGLLRERSITHQTLGCWGNGFGPGSASVTRRRDAELPPTFSRSNSKSKWYSGEVFAKMNHKRQYLRWTTDLTCRNKDIRLQSCYMTGLETSISVAGTAAPDGGAGHCVTSGADS